MNLSDKRTTFGCDSEPAIAITIVGLLLLLVVVRKKT
jgi:hypothetical protein